MTCMAYCGCAGDIVACIVMYMYLKIYPRISGILWILVIECLKRGILLYTIMWDPLDAFKIFL